MKIVGMLAAAAMLVGGQAMAHDVDVVFVASPVAVEDRGIEAINDAVERWVDLANENMAANAVDLTYHVKAVVEGDGSVQETAISEIAYAIGEQLKTDAGQFVELRERFGADYITYITPEQDQYNAYGAAYESAAQAIAFVAPSATWAHEAGHAAAMEHPDDETCASENLLMCQTSQGRQDDQPLAITSSNRTLLAASLNNESPGYTDWVMMGYIAEPMTILGNVDLIVTGDSVNADNIGDVDFELTLVDETGAALVLEEPVSIEIYTKGTNTDADDYDADFTQRITFLAGEAVKTATLSVSVDAGAQDKTVEVGLRYGEKVVTTDEAAYSATVKKQETSSGGDVSDGGSGGGGSLGWITLLALGGLARLKRA